MKILKRIGIVVLILVALILVIALFVSKDYHVERSIVINKPKAQVFDYIKLLKNQDSYSKWNMTDPAKKTEFRGTDGTVGFVYAWDGNKAAGKGEQEIKKIVEGQRIETEVRFEKPMKAVSPVYMTTDAAGDGLTKVTWAMDGHMRYPLNAMRLVMNLEKMLGDDMQTSLGNLKSNLEKAP